MSRGYARMLPYPLMPRRPQPLRIAIDTGGTFTDCVWIESRTAVSAC